MLPIQETVNNVLLSREELLLISKLIDAQSMFGLETADPEIQLNEDQVAYGIVCAERALRARGMAIIDEQKRLKINQDVLLMVAVCAYPAQSVFLHQSKNDQPTFRYYAHQQNGIYVSHQFPSPALHFFNKLPDANTLLDQSADFCTRGADEKVTTLNFIIEPDTFEKARLAGNKKAEGEVTEILSKAVDNTLAIQLFGATLLSDYLITFVHVLNNLPDGKIAKQQFTVLAEPQACWLITERPTEGDNFVWEVQGISKANLKYVFARLLGLA